MDSNNNRKKALRVMKFLVVLWVIWPLVASILLFSGLISPIAQIQSLTGLSQEVQVRVGVVFGGQWLFFTYVAYDRPRLEQLWKCYRERDRNRV